MSSVVDPSPPRSALRSSNRILIKAGTSVVTSPNGYPSLTRLASLVEQIAELKAEGKQVRVCLKYGILTCMFEATN